MYGGQWCIGVRCVALGPAHPLELPLDDAAEWEASPYRPFTGEFEGKGVKEWSAPPEEEDGGGEGSMFPKKKAKSAKKTYAAGTYAADTAALDAFQSTVTFTPWRPSDCDNVEALPTE